MKIVVYIRVNSQNQIEQATEKQISACQEYAKEKGYTIIAQYIDIGSREQFEQMIKDSSKKQFEAIIVYSMERFSRNRYDSVIHKRKLKQNGVKVISVQENFSDDASGILMESVIEGLIEYYSLEHSKKIKAGIERKKKEREMLANEG